MHAHANKCKHVRGSIGQKVAQCETGRGEVAKSIIPNSGRLWRIMLNSILLCD